jgi:hypothetical protein
MDWTTAIDIYCERSSAGFWAEPLNAWSNLSFPLAALWAGVAARREGGASAEYWILVALAALVGVGSFLFHTFANVWSEYADTIPIWMFVAAAILVATRRVAGLRPGPLAMLALAAGVALVVAYVAPTDPIAQPAPPADPLNGSGQYAPALAAMAAMAALAWWRGLPTRHTLLAATAVFVAALAFRTIDLRVCATFPTGTHFLWHLLLGVMVGLILHALRDGAAAARPPQTGIVRP